MLWFQLLGQLHGTTTNKYAQIRAMDPTMPMMLAQAASIIDIVGAPFLLSRPSSAMLVF